MNEAQRERLVMLAEEAAEIVQAATKALRHGYSSYNPYDSHKTTNRDLLENELRDLFAIADRMVFEGDLNSEWTDDDLDYTWNKKLKFTHYQKETL